MVTIYQYSLNYADLTGRATVNGFPVAVFDTVSSGVSSGPLNHLLLAGDNILKVDVARRGSDAFLEGKVDVVAQGAVVDTRSGGQFALPEGAAPPAVEHRFSAEQGPLSRLLETLKPADMAQVGDYLLEVGRVIRAGDRAVVASLFRPKFLYLAEAMGYPPQAIEPELEQLAEAFAGADLSLDGGNLALEACCDGKLVPLVRPDGTQLLRVEADGGSMQIDAAVGTTPEGPALVI